MATYKVIQDIEAEDTLVGPLSLRQFIYAGIGAFCLYLDVVSVMKHVPFLLAMFTPVAIFCFFFAWPWSPDQPTEVWALARIRFYFKPRRRIWDQSGVKELVTITAPKRVERIYTNGLSQTEVRSRLTALADTIDSRGWAIKNANVNLSTSTAYVAQPTVSDRLIAMESIPQPVPAVDVQASDDIMDPQNNPIAHQFDEMINASAKAHRQEIVEKLKAPAETPAPTTPTPDYWFLHQSQAAQQHGGAQANDVVFANPQVVQPGAVQAIGPVAADPTADEQALAQELKSQNTTHHAEYSHLKTIQPPGYEPPVIEQPTVVEAPVLPPPMPAPAPIPVPSPTDAAILDLANNNDLNVATIAREAHKARVSASDDEVVISLH